MEQADRWAVEQRKWYKSDDKDHFVREETKFRGVVTADGSSGFRAEPGRYHLYVSFACPWAHRTLVARALLRLEARSASAWCTRTWATTAGSSASSRGATGDGLHGARYLYEVYTRAKSDYSGRVTVPVLWDKQTETIVCNESRLILRMLSTIRRLRRRGARALSE